MTLTNTGNVALTFTSFSITGTSSSDFAQTNNCGASVSAGGSCSISVTFTPSATGSRNAVLTIVDNAPNSPQNVSLRGTGSSDITTSTLVSSLNPSSFGQAVTFTAMVTTKASKTPTGTVTFHDGSTALGTGTLNGSGIATYTTPSLAVGQHFMTAVYSGEVDNGGSTSAVLVQTVNAATTTMTVVSSSNPSWSGSPVTFSATVTTRSPEMPTGIVRFKDGATGIGAATLDASGVATVTTSSLTVGQHSITAIYGGDANDNGSTSAVLSQTVKAADFELSSSPARTTVSAGSSAPFTVTVTPQGSFTNSISFSCSGLPALATCTFKPASVTPNASITATSVTITTMAPAASLAPPSFGHRASPVYAMWFVLPSMLLGMTGLAKPNRRKLASYLVVCLLAGGCMLQAACGSGNSRSGGGGGSGGTPAGTYTITVTGTAASTSHTTTVTLTVQ